MRKVSIVAAALLLGYAAPDRSGVGEEYPSALNLASAATREAAPAVPRFEDYPVPPPEIFRGRSAPVDFSTDPGSRRFRTVLRAGTAKGPNFAGYIAAITWGCGTSCQVTAFVDVRTGRIVRQSIISNIGVAYRPDSRLFVADPPERRRPDAPADCISCGQTAYYLWQGNRLVPFGSGPHIHLQSW
jgi:hypothetical protein